MTSQLVGPQWFQLLEKEFNEPYMVELREKLKQEYSFTTVRPAPNDIFRAFKLTPPDQVKVIIIGQDPYPFGYHADGLAFSSKESETPYSLKMVLREVDRDVVKTKNYHEFKRLFPTNDLSSWANQGVLLLNTVLTVRAGEVGSHSQLGWQRFTKYILDLLYRDSVNPLCYLAWGSEANKVLTEVFKNETEHPRQGYGAGHPASGAHGKDKFSGCSFASKTNIWLLKKGSTEINWKLDDSNNRS